jgi:hypothetical protein
MSAPKALSMPPAVDLRGLSHHSLEARFAEEGRQLALIVAEEMDEEALLRRACEARGRSVLAVKAERLRVLKSRAQ